MINNEINKKIALKLKILPSSSGCYFFKDINEKIIYIGKAKNLKNRIKSYFTGAHNQKTTLLVSNIFDFDFVLTNNEQESLILELNLIKQHRPKYNILLIDDKTYPYIRIIDEKNPRLEIIRTIHKLKDKNVFGPFPDSYSARQVLTLLNQLYPLRKCKNIPTKPCIYYHMNNCLAPCINLINKHQYDQSIKEIIAFFKGNNTLLINSLTNKMNIASENLNFEQAIEYNSLIKAIEDISIKQIVNLNDGAKRDIIGIAFNDDLLSIQILKMIDGKISATFNEVIQYINDPISSSIDFLNQYYLNNFFPKELLLSSSFDINDLNNNLNFDEKKLDLVIPKIGDKKKLVELATLNATNNLNNYHQLYLNKEDAINDGIDELSNLVGFNVYHLEAFDNSHLFGISPISAMITFKNKQFIKKDYRTYKLQSTTNDDLKAVYEVVTRRYSKIKPQNINPCDLILIDGGLNQVIQANKALADLGLNILCCGLIKDETHKLSGIILFNEKIILNRRSALYKLLAKISDEVHRFALSFHVKSRNKQTYASILDNIPGLGPKKRGILLTTFNSLSEIYNASFDTLKKNGIDEKLAIKIKEALKDAC